MNNDAPPPDPRIVALSREAIKAGDGMSVEEYIAARRNNITSCEAEKIRRAFAESSPEIRETVLEMSEIIADESSTSDERTLALDAIMQALKLDDDALAWLIELRRQDHEWLEEQLVALHHHDALLLGVAFGAVMLAIASVAVAVAT